MRNFTPLMRGGRNLGAAMGGQDAIEGKAYEEEMAKLMMSANRQAQAQKHQTEAALNEERLRNMRAGRETFMQNATGLPQDQYGELATAMQEGWMQKEAEGPPTPDGVYPTMDDIPAFVTPEVVDRYRTGQMTLAANDVATGKTNAEQLMATMQAAMELGRQDKMISGQMDPDAVAAAMAATAGKPTVDVTGSGIAFKPYGDPQDLNTAAFDRANEVKHQSKASRAHNLTPTQQANNTEIDAARQAIANLSREDIIKRTQQFTATGRENPDYDPYLASMIKKATRRKVGNDPDFESVYQNFFGDAVGQDNDQPPRPDARKAADGYWYIPDPNRPGKYVRVRRLQEE